MKTLGLIGGMSWESTQLYYQIINKKVREYRKDLSSAPLYMYSYDFLKVETLQHQGKWDELTESMIDVAKKLELSGAESIVICTNTMHMMAEEMQEKIKIPIIHIADATAKKIKEKGMNKIALLGTKFTMEKEFYKNRLSNIFGIEVLIPNEKDRDIVHHIIYEELCNGVIKDQSRNEYTRIIKELAERGAEGVILGCTEITMLVSQKDSCLPIFDTTEIHALAAAEFCLGIE